MLVLLVIFLVLTKAVPCISLSYLDSDRIGTEVIDLEPVVRTISQEGLLTWLAGS